MRKLWLLVPLAILGILFYSSAQTPTPGPKVVPSTPAPQFKVAPPNARGRELPQEAEPIRFSAQMGLDWLKRTLTIDGRFVYGFQPSLRVQLDGDNFGSQAGATFALARAARHFRDEGGTARARQAILTLLLQTMSDPDDKNRPVLFPAAPPFAVNRLSSNGLIVSAIHELESPEKVGDLLDKADRMCNYLRDQQQPDGALFVSVGSNPIKSGSDHIDAEHAGWALQGIIRSQKLRPAAWKVEMLSKARRYYLAQWQASKSIATVCSHTPAYAEAFVRTNDPAFKEAVYAMNDWLVGLQYRDEFDAARKHWAGGFPRYRDGKTETIVPDISSALPAESLAEACRVAKHAGDLGKLRDYERALLANLYFLTTLQYTSDKTKHFVDPFRPYILGAFHASHQDGNLRIDYTQHALCAMVQYLDTVVD